MDNRTTIVSLVEEAARRMPLCDCGAQMVAVEHDGDLWLECVEHDRHVGGRLSRLRSGRWLEAHARRLLLDRNELSAA